MKRFLIFLFTLTFLLYFPSVVIANNDAEEYITNEELQKLAEENGWDEIRQPQNAFILPIDILSDALFENFQIRNTNFMTEPIPLRPLQEGEKASDRTLGIQQAVYLAVRTAARQDESIAYDLRSYQFGFKIVNDYVSFIFHYEYGQTYQQVQYVNNEVQRIISTIIHPSMNIHEKIKVIHDYVVQNTSYDITMNQQINTPYHALKNKKTLCSGYSQLTYLLLKEAGIEARIISGESQGILHAWNLVKVNDAWYHLDTTWNDPIPDRPDRILYTYYMLSDQAMKKTHTWKNGGINNYDLPYPQANHSYVTLLQNEKLYNTLLTLKRPITQINTEEELFNLIQQSIDRYEPSLTIALPMGTLTKQQIESTITKFFNHPDLSHIYYSYEQSPFHFSHMNEAHFQFQYTHAPTLTSLKWHGIHKSIVTTEVSKVFPFQLIATWDNGKRLDVTQFSDVSFQPLTGAAIRESKYLYFVKKGVIHITSTYRNFSISHQIQIQDEIKSKVPNDYQLLQKNTLTTKSHKKRWSLLFNKPIDDPSQIVIHSLEENRDIPFSISQMEQGSLYRLTISPETVWSKGKHIVFLTGLKSAQQPSQLLEEQFYFTFEVK